MTENANRTAAAIIAQARDNHPAALGDGSAAFDYAIAAGSALATQALQSAAWAVANKGHDADTSDVKDARMWHTLDVIADELGAYRARCKARSYTGWSKASAGPIRYA